MKLRLFSSQKEPGKSVENASASMKRVFKFCGNLFPVKTGALVVGILESVSVVFFLGVGMASFTILNYAFGPTYGSPLLIIPLLAFLATLGVLLPFFMGLKKEKAKLLLPHLILQAFLLMVFFIGVVLGIVILAESPDSGGYLANRLTGDFLMRNNGQRRAGVQVRSPTARQSQPP